MKNHTLNQVFSDFKFKVDSVPQFLRSFSRQFYSQGFCEKSNERKPQKEIFFHNTFCEIYLAWCLNSGLISFKTNTLRTTHYHGDFNILVY